MTFVDANILLRFLTKQPEEQAERAREFLARAQSGELELVLTPLTIAEVVYVLTGAYAYSHKRTRDEILAVWATGAVRIEHETECLEALSSMGPSIDFADAYLARRAVTAGGAVASFDKDFGRLGAEWIRP